MLTLFEELFLLALHEEKGAVIPAVASRLGYGLAGAVIAELALLGKVRVGENRRLELLEENHTGDEILDKALDQIRESENIRKVTFWIRAFSDRPKQFNQHLAERLVNKGVLTQEDNHFGSVIPFVSAPEQKASARYWIKSRLRALVFTLEEPDLRGLALLGLVHACGLSFLVFTKDERKMAGKRVYELMIGKALSDPLAQVIEEIDAALESLVGAG